MKLFCVFLWATFPAFSFGQEPATAAAGYVVRVESGSIYLDLGEKSGASLGQSFHVYTEGEELKHPVTGQVLGRVEKPLAQGTLREILPLYSIGALSSPEAKIKPGMRARLDMKPQALAPASKEESPGATPAARAPRWKSPLFDYEIVGMAIADFKGGDQFQVALADKKTIFLYPYPPKDDKPLAQLTLPGTAPRIVSLEAADLNQSGRAEIFASLYNETLGRMETVVLEIDGDKLKKIAEIPGVVRAHQDASGKTTLAVQQLLENSTFPFSSIHPLVFRDGKYAPGPKPIRLKRVDWIYDFTTADLGGNSPALLYLTSTNHLRVQFDKGYWKTPDSFGQSPTRVRWQGRLLEFHLPMPMSYDDQKHASVYLVRNLSRFGSLSEPFGLFSGAEIWRMTWSGLSFESDWKASPSGYVPAIALVYNAGKPRDMTLAVVGSSGKSSLWVYDP